MSNITDFFPSGGGGASVPLNAISQFANAPVLHTDEQDGVWLKAGYLETDVNSYPNAYSNAYNIEDSSFLNSFSLNGIDTNPVTVHFSTDGTKMVFSGTQNQKLYLLNLSTAWDIETAVYSGNSFDLSGIDSVTWEGISFKPDGTRFYIKHTYSGSSRTTQYDMSTAWDLENAVMGSHGNLNSYNYNGMFWKPDGTRIFILISNTYIAYYDLSTPWDISSAPSSYNGLSSRIDSGTYLYIEKGLFFKDDGRKFYIFSTYRKEMLQYSMSSAWDVSTASFDYAYDITYIGSHYINSFKSMFFKPSGTNFYAIQSHDGNVYDFSLPSSWNIASASVSKTFSIGTYDSAQQNFYFKPDLTKFFTVGSTIDKVFTYDVITPGVITTSNVKRSFDFDLSSQDTLPTGIYFKSDGSKMYVLGTENDRIYEYNLSVNWDATTAVFSQHFSLDGLNPYDLFFRPDGSSVYLIDATSQGVRRYDLSTPWDISTMTFVNSFDVSLSVANPRGVSFDPSGHRMFVSGINGVSEFSLEDSWDTSKAYFLRSVTSTAAQGTAFNADGSVLYVFDYSSDTVKQFDIPVGVGLFDNTGLLPDSYIKIK